MGSPHPMALRQRGVALVEEGSSHRPAAAWFPVSVTFVNDMVILKRGTGGLAPKAMAAVMANGLVWGLDHRAKARSDPERPGRELADHRGIAIHRVSVWRFSRGLGLTPEKDLQALEQKRPEIRQAISASRDANRSCAAR